MTITYDPSGSIIVNLDPGGVSSALIAKHAADFPHADIAHANRADLDAYDPALFDLSGSALEVMASHLMELNPHSQYLTVDELPPAPTRETLGLDTTDTVQFGEIIIKGLIPGTAYKIIIDGDGNIGTEQVL